MACKKKEKKYPKKPKAGASLKAMENYLQKCKQIDAENKKIRAHNKKCEEMKKKIQTVGR